LTRRWWITWFPETTTPSVLLNIF